MRLMRVREFVCQSVRTYVYTSVPTDSDCVTVYYVGRVWVWSCTVHGVCQGGCVTRTTA